MTLKDKAVLVLGGYSGIGFGVAAAAQAGALITVASRSAAKVEAAVARLSGTATGTVLGTGDDQGLKDFFAGRAAFDHVFCPAASTSVAVVRDLPLKDAYATFDSKFWGAYRLARAAQIAPGGSLTLTSGFLTVRPKTGAAIQEAINAALEGLTRGLALEFAPVR